MLLAAALLVCLATVPLAGGRLCRLADLELRRTWTVALALALQVVIVYLIPDWPDAVLSAAHVATYGLAAAFVVANRRVPGLLVIAAGGASNLLVIAINGGVMPASRSALRTAGLDANPDRFATSITVDDARLAFLGDVFAVPASWPVHNVFSVGDIVIVLGALVLLHCASGSALMRAWSARPYQRRSAARAAE